MKRTVLALATLATLASLTLAAVPALAQSRSFEGFSLLVNAESLRSTSERGGIVSDTATSMGFGIQAQYAIAVSPSFVLGLGLSGSSGPRAAGTVGGTEFSTKNFVSVDLVPGFAINDSLLLYGKLSALTATSLSLVSATGVSSTEEINGAGFGLGLRALVDKNLFFQVGYDENRFADKGAGTLTLKPASSLFSLGIGYKF